MYANGYLEKYNVPRKTYSAEFKAKIVLEVLEGNKTLNQIATKYDLLYIIAFFLHQHTHY